MVFAAGRFRPPSAALRLGRRFLTGFSGSFQASVRCKAKPQCGHRRVLSATAMLSVYQGPMIARAHNLRPALRAAAATALLLLGAGLGGCANVGDSMVSSAFVDPAK